MPAQIYHIIGGYKLSFQFYASETPLENLTRIL